MSSTGAKPIEEKSGAVEALTSGMSKPIKHQPLRVGLILFTVFFFFAVIWFNYMSSSKTGRDWGVFLNKTGDISDKYYIEIVPSGWAFSIWGFIYLWQIAWLLYVVAGIFRKHPDGGYVYITFETETPFFYVMFLINLGCNVAWIIIFDRQYVGWALIPIAILPLTLYVCLVISHMRLMENGSHMMEIGMKKDIWMVRLFIQNGLAFYATWVTIATLLNLAIVMTYRLNVDQSTACTVSLSILLVEIIGWFILDIFVLERYTRYLLTPYFVINFALAASLAKNYIHSATNSVFTIVLICLAACAAVTKVVALFYRRRTRPLKYLSKINDSIRQTTDVIRPLEPNAPIESFNPMESDDPFTASFESSV